jgi:hypothetical protein
LKNAPGLAILHQIFLHPWTEKRSLKGKSKQTWNGKDWMS